jgi:hypothetical protein
MSRIKSLPNWILAAWVVLAPVAINLLGHSLQAELVWPFLESKNQILTFELRGTLSSAGYAEFVARLYLFGTASLALIIAGLVVWVAGVWIIRRSLGNRGGLVAIFLSLTVGIGYVVWTYHWASSANLTRLRIVNDVLCEAQRVEMLPRFTLDRLLWVLTINAMFASGALCTLLSAFAIVARPHRTNLPNGTEILRTELWHLRILIGSASLVLIPLVASTFALILLTLPLIDPDSAASTARLATAVSTFAGATFALSIILAAILTFASIGLQAQSLAQQAVQDASHSGRIKWLQDNGIELSPVRILSSLAGALGPLLAAPVLDFVGSLLQFAPGN